MALDDLLSIMNERERALLIAATEIYGDGTDDLLNALQAIAARIAVYTGVDPEKFAGGFKHHWDYLANAINKLAGSAEKA